MHVLGHRMCPRESMEASEQSFFGGIERGNVSSKDIIFPCDPSRPFSTDVAPIDVPSALRRRPHRLGRGLPRQPFPYRVRLIRPVSWRVLHERCISFCSHINSSLSRYVAMGGESRPAAALVRNLDGVDHLGSINKPIHWTV